VTAAPSLIHCRVRVVVDGRTFEFENHYLSTFDAIIHGQEIAEDVHCRVTAKAIV